LKTLLVLWIETSVISPDGTRWYGIASQNNELGLIDTRNKTLEKQQQQQQQPKAATRLVLSRLERRNQQFSRVCDDDEWCGHAIT
jgi:hypothetical protein